MEEYLKQYTEYITNAGNPTVEQFDDDWSPIGERVRLELYKARAIYTRSGRLWLANQTAPELLELMKKA